MQWRFQTSRLCRILRSQDRRLLFSTQTLSKLLGQRNSVFATNFNFLIHISLQPCGVKLWNFKLIRSKKSRSLEYLWSSTSGCQDLKIRKSEFVAKTYFLFKLNGYTWEAWIFINTIASNTWGVFSPSPLKRRSPPEQMRQWSLLMDKMWNRNFT